MEWDEFMWRTKGAVKSQVWDCIWEQTTKQLKFPVWAKVWSEGPHQVQAQLRDRVEDQAQEDCDEMG
jgi:hypothetical protein